MEAIVTFLFIKLKKQCKFNKQLKLQALGEDQTSIRT